MPVPTVSIDATGISAPEYTAVLAGLVADMRGIFGDDIYIEPDSQDGEMLAIFARAIHDTNSAVIAVYNAFSPSTAIGAGLSRVVKINGISRKVATNSTVDLVVVGVAGTTIQNGVAQDDGGNRWNLPATVIIPVSGQITVTAVAQNVGAVIAPANSVTTIFNPTRGWQAVFNPLAAVSGIAIESNAELRRRQALSTALPSTTMLEGIVGSVLAIEGVTSCDAYENDSDATDANGIPAHSVALVVEGGDAQAIAAVIARKKGPGVGTYGSTVETVTDAYGVPHEIGFFRPISVAVAVAITIQPLPGYTASIQAKIGSGVSTKINASKSGDSVIVSRLYTPANLTGADSETFDIVSIEIARDGNPTQPANVPIAFNERAACEGVVVNIFS